MRNLQRNRNFFSAAVVALALLPGVTAVSAGESQMMTSDLPTPNSTSSWSNRLTPVSAEVETDREVESRTGHSSAGNAQRSADGATSDNFVPLLATERSRSLAATRGIADSTTAGLLEPEASGNPAVVPLPASVWAGLAVLLMTVWLGRHSKRRLRLPI